MWGPHLTQCPIAENGWIYFEMVFGFFLVLAPGLVMGPHVQTCPSQIWTSTYVCVSSPALGNQRQPSANTQKTDLEMSSCLENFVRNTPARTPATFFFILNISRQSGWFFVGEWFMQAVMGSDFVTGDCDEDEFPEMSQVLVRSWQVPRVFPSVTSGTKCKNNTPQVVLCHLICTACHSYPVPISKLLGGSSRTAVPLVFCFIYPVFQALGVELLLVMLRTHAAYSYIDIYIYIYSKPPKESNR